MSTLLLSIGITNCHVCFSIKYARDEAAHARQHEMRMMEMFMTMQQQVNSFPPQHQPAYSMQPTSAASGNNGSFFRNFAAREEHQNVDNQMYYRNP